MSFRVVLNPNQIHIQPLKMQIDKKLTKRNIAPFPNTSHCMVISGAMKSGKTTLIQSLLIGKGKAKVYNKVFKKVHIISPQVSLESMEDDHPFRNHERVYTEITPDILGEIKHQCEELKKDGEFSLLVIDDFGSDLKNKEISNILNQLTTRHRHLNLTIWFLQQSLMQMELNLRKLIGYYIIFKPKSPREVITFMEEINAIPRRDVNELFELVFKKKYDRLLIDIGNNKLYKNNDLIEFNDEPEETEDDDDIEK
jgi:predicted AAA+ superfamily ATPase